MLGPTNAGLSERVVSDLLGWNDEDKAVRFFDYDGSIVRSYTAEEFAALTAMPDNPIHPGLTSEGWNWTLADAKTYVANHGYLDIGQSYITDNGETRLYITLDDPYGADREVTMKLGQSRANGVTIDWGDGTDSETNNNSGAFTVTHTYIGSGSYVIRLMPDDGVTLYFKYIATYVSFLGNNSILRGANLGTGLLIPISGYSLLYSNSRLEWCTIGTEHIDLFNYVQSTNHFGYCSSLKHITLPDGVTILPQSMCYMSYGLKSVSIPNSVLTLGGSIFNYCNFRRICLPDAIESLSSFSSNSALEKICLPTGLLEFSSTNAFADCYNLKSLELPSSITELKLGTFMNVQLESIELPSALQTISNNVFNSNKVLKTIRIPSGVTSIGSGAFSCHSLRTIYCQPTTPPTLANTNAFPSTTYLKKIYVPAASLTAYQEATNWSAFASIMEGV